jgi:hypothetical protein
VRRLCENALFCADYQSGTDRLSILPDMTSKGWDCRDLPP